MTEAEIANESLERSCNSDDESDDDLERKIQQLLQRPVKHLEWH